MPASSSTRRSKASRRRTSVSTRSTATAVADLARAVEQRELAEEPARSDDGQDRRLAAVLGRDQDLDRPARHDEQGVAGIAAVEDRLATPEATRAQGADHQVEPRLVQAGEQPAGHERLADERIVGRAGHHVAIVRGRGAVR